VVLLSSRNPNGSAPTLVGDFQLKPFPTSGPTTHTVGSIRDGCNWAQRRVARLPAGSRKKCRRKQVIVRISDDTRKHMIRGGKLQSGPNSTRYPVLDLPQT